MQSRLSQYTQKGDTIIEVLIAITIAAFAIGSSYAIASKSLQQAISARERNEALNVMESQISALKFRQQRTDTTGFNNNFALPHNHFCLDETATGPSSPTWLPSQNNGSISSNTPLTVGSSGNTYTARCVKNGNYFVDITTQNAGGSVPTVYGINVRWERIGGGPFNEARIYYRF